MAAAKLAEAGWLRIGANMGAGCYDTWEAVGEIPEPKWPDVSFRELLRLCFQGRMIDRADHPIIRRLRGE